MRSATLLRNSLWLALVVAGCTSDVEIPERPVLEPVHGVVTLNGKPLAGAVVTFLNQDERGTLTVGETDADGVYRLKYLGAEGTAAGPYRVAVSYLMGTEGQVIGLARRSTLSPTAEVNTAKELLPPHYSDLGRTKLTAKVPPGGGSFPFALEGSLLAPPTSPATEKVTAEGKEDGEKEKEKAKPTETTEKAPPSPPEPAP